jgi:hypothetical protein
MYLRKAWHYNKLFFALVVLFIIGQLFVTYNRGMVFSPFFNYSMYSAAYPRVDTLDVLEFYTGGRPLSPSQLSTRNWDKLSSAYNYSANMQRNEWVLSEMQRLTRAAGLKWPIEPYQNQLTQDEMEKKWTAMFVKVTGKQVDSVRWGRYLKREGKWIKK